MIDGLEIKTDRLVLRHIFPEDVGEYYAKWLNDPEVSGFLESGGKVHTVESIRDWVKWNNNSADRLLLGIFSDGGHIGNITFYDIDKKNKVLRIGVMIGDKSLWGLGYGKEAVKGAMEFAFLEMSMHRVEAGIHSENKSSVCMFESLDFMREAVFKERLFCGGKFFDMFLYVKIKNMGRK